MNSGGLGSVDDDTLVCMSTVATTTRSSPARTVLRDAETVASQTLSVPWAEPALDPFRRRWRGAALALTWR